MMLSLWNKLVTPIRQRGAWFRGAVCAVVRLDHRRFNLVTVSQVGGGLIRRGPPAPCLLPGRAWPSWPSWREPVLSRTGAPFLLSAPLA